MEKDLFGECTSHADRMTDKFFLMFATVMFDSSESIESTYLLFIFLLLFSSKVQQTILYKEEGLRKKEKKFITFLFRNHVNK
jgi:hypothetical protein